MKVTIKLSCSGNEGPDAGTVLRHRSGTIYILLSTLHVDDDEKIVLQSQKTGCVYIEPKRTLRHYTVVPGATFTITNEL